MSAGRLVEHERRSAAYRPLPRSNGVLGRGAMGVVYRAHDPEIDRPVAIKLIRADLLDGDDRDDFLARFRREAQAAGRCMHPNIVAIYDFALHEGNPFLAMEFVDGISLESGAANAARCSHPPTRSAIILQVLEALGAAHAMGIVHRDIKPANILMRRRQPREGDGFRHLAARQLGHDAGSVR